MPTIVKQVPQSTAPVNGARAVAQPAPQTGITSARTMQRGRMKVLLYGRSGVGKSTLSVEWPKPLLAMACEPRENGGADSIIGTEGVDVAVAQLKPLPNESDAGTAKMLRLTQWMYSVAEQTGACPYASITVDATALQDLVLAEIMGWESIDTIIKRPRRGESGGVGRGVFMERADRVRELLRKIASLPCNVIFLAQEKDHNPPKDEDGNAVGSKLVRAAQEKSFMAASLGDSTCEWLQNACTHVCQLYMDAEVREETITVDVAGTPTSQVIRAQTGKFVRRLRTNYSPNYAARITSNVPSAVPEYIETNDPRAMYAALVEVSRGVRVKEGKYAD